MRPLKFYWIEFVQLFTDIKRRHMLRKHIPQLKKIRGDLLRQIREINTEIVYHENLIVWFRDRQTDSSIHEKVEKVMNLRRKLKRINIDFASVNNKLDHIDRSLEQ